MKFAAEVSGALHAARRFAPELSAHKTRLAGAFALSLVVAACQVLLPWPIQWIFDGALVRTEELERAPSFYLWSGAAALLALVVVQALAQYLSQVACADIGQRVARALRLRLLRQLTRLGPAFFARHKSGDLLVRLLGDVSMVRTMLVEAGLEFAARAAWVAGTVAVMLAVDARLTLWLAALLPLVAWVVRVLSRRIEVAARKQRRKEGELAGSLLETLGAAELIQSLGRSEHVVRKLAAASRRSERAGSKSARLAARMAGSVHALLGLGVAVTLLAGSSRVLEGSMSAGELLVFLSYVRGLLKPVRSASRTSERFAKGAACAQRVAEVLDARVAVESAPGAPAAPLRPRELAFDDVVFRYDSERDALAGFSARFVRGELCGVFGQSGAGKSTLAALSVRLFDPERGAVRIDGLDLRELDLDSVRARVGLCAQRSVLLGESVRENLALARPEASDAELWNALARAAAEDFVRALPAGLDSSLGASGSGLSGGESRRIALARTLLADTPIVVVDEPFAGLDRAAAYSVLATLRQLARERVVVVIAHETNFLVEYDRVVFVEDGRARATGTHAELLERDERYRELAGAAEVCA